jgi:hypothetical protein
MKGTRNLTLFAPDWASPRLYAAHRCQQSPLANRLNHQLAGHPRYLPSLAILDGFEVVWCSGEAIHEGVLR